MQPAKVLKTLKNLKRVIENDPLSMEFLETLKEHETKHKKRESVLALLNKALSNLQEEGVTVEPDEPVEPAVIPDGYVMSDVVEGTFEGYLENGWSVEEMIESAVLVPLEPEALHGGVTHVVMIKQGLPDADVDVSMVDFYETAGWVKKETTD